MTDDVTQITEAVAHVEHGFKPQQDVAAAIVAERLPDDAFALALELFESESVPVRMTAVLIAEGIVGDREVVLAFLRGRVSADPAWQVQEMLGRAFDAHCRATGYEQALPIIEEWLASPVRNLRRAVTEGLRIWTSRPYFKQHPEVAIQLLSSKRDDPEKYVRESAGNALRDISKRYPELVRAELATWDRTDKAIAQTYKLAARFLESPKNCS
ncbi:HEAT repeat domain-containing protein [soil metagenome]